MDNADNHITYSLAEIQRYLQGGMSTKEMHELERAALNDPFLADALEGYSDADMQQAQTHLRQVEAAIRQPHQQKNVVALPRYNKYRNWQQIAAAVIVLACIASITYFIIYKKANDTTLAANKSNGAITSTDSVQVNVLNTVPHINDTTATHRNEQAPDTQSEALVATNKKTKVPQLQQPMPKTPAPANSVAQEEDIKNLRANSMALRASAVAITGTIIDTHQQPVPNATIMLQDSTAVITDKEGNFRIATDDSTTVANITAFGYKPIQNQPLKSGYNNIILKEKPFLLSDVEVVNIGTTGKEIDDTTATMPEGGWQSFKEYVYNKLQRRIDSNHLANAYINGDLQLEFSISEEGNPVNFKVLHAPDTQVVNDAISAIQAGPKWINTSKKNKMKITVKYK